MIPIALVWDDATRLGGVNTWLFQCVERLPAHGLEPWIIDLASSHSGSLDVSRWRDSILPLRQHRWQSASRFRQMVARQFSAKGFQLVVFQEGRHAEDVLRCLPENFPAINVLHVDRPDPRYLGIAAALDPRLREHCCVSSQLAGKLRSILPADRASRVHYMPLGIELPPGKPALRTPNDMLLKMVYAGRLDQDQKRILDLVPFVDELQRLGLRFRMDVFGSGPCEAALSSSLSASPANVRMHGSRPHREVMAALDEAHFVVLFSAYEGMPLLLLESMARGAVPVATRISSGVPDIIAAGVNGCLFPIGEPAVAAREIATLWADRKLLETLARCARDTAEQFDLMRCLASYAELFRRTASQTNSATNPDGPVSPVTPRMGIRGLLRDHLPPAVLALLGKG